MKTWPDYLAHKLQLRCVNFGARGSGLDFLSKRILAHNFESNDLVGIMLPSADRYDWYVDSNHPLKSDALEISSWQNGKSPELVKIDGTGSTESGYSLSGGWHRGYKKYWFKYFYSESKAVLDYWSTVLFLQRYLQSENIDYFFTSVYNRDDLVEQDDNQLSSIDTEILKVKNKVDFTKFIYYDNNKGFLQYADDNGFSRLAAKDLRHKKLLYPVTEAHEAFANFLYNHLQRINP